MPYRLSFLKRSSYWTVQCLRLIAVAISLAFCQSLRADYTVTSPDGLVLANVTTISGGLYYSVSYGGTNVIGMSPLGVTINNFDLGSGVTFTGASVYSTNINIS